MASSLHPIIATFLAAREQAQRDFAIQQQAVQFQQKQKLDEEQAKEQKRQFDEQLKRVKEQFIAKHKLKESEFKVNLEKLKLDVGKQLGMAGVTSTGPVSQEQALEAAQTGEWQKGYKPVSFQFGEFEIPGEYFISPEQVGEAQAKLQAPSLRLRTAEALKLLQPRLEAQERIAELQQIGQEERLTRQLNAREALEKYKQNQANYRASLRQNNVLVPPAINTILGEHERAKVTQRYITGREAIEFVNSLPATTTSPADDIGLVYAFAKAMDPESVVREGEYSNVQKYSQALIDKFGYGVKRVWQNSQFLTPEARSLMKNTIRSKVMATENLYHAYRTGIKSRIRNLTGKDTGDLLLGPFLSDKVAQPIRNIRDIPAETLEEVK